MQPGLDGYDVSEVSIRASSPAPVYIRLYFIRIATRHVQMYGQLIESSKGT